MKIFNVIEIFDNGEFVTIITNNGAVHLPMNSFPSITVQPINNPSDEYTITVNVDLYQE